MGATPKPLKRLRFDTDGQDEADGRLVTSFIHCCCLLTIVWTALLKNRHGAQIFHQILFKFPAKLKKGLH